MNAGKRIARIILFSYLFTLSFSYAQQNWFGVRTGYPLGVTLHYGIENALENGFDLRVSANLRIRSANQVDFGIGIDGLNEIYSDRPFSLYLGGGPALDFNGNSALIDVHALLGGEFSFVDVGLNQFSMFAEVSLGAGIGINRNSQIPSAGGAVGFNWYF